MAKNNDGIEAGAPVSIEDILRIERQKRREAIDGASAPTVEPEKPKTTRKTRKTTDKIDLEADSGSPSKS